MRKSLVFVLTFLFLLPVLINAALPIDGGGGGGNNNDFPPWAKSIFGDMFGFPEEWLKMPEFMYYAIIPLLGIWMIIYGFITAIRIFGVGRRALYTLLSFFIAFSTLPLRVFTLFVSVMFSAIGVGSVGVFLFLFFFGVGIMVYQRYKVGRAGIGHIKHLEGEIRALDQDIVNLQNKLQREKDPGKRDNLMKKIALKREERKNRIDRMADISRV